MYTKVYIQLRNCMYACWLCAFLEQSHLALGGVIHLEVCVQYLVKAQFTLA